ncbi:hypothetical protein MKX08_005469 [Trichoderma sp. CBMAI-0020]|nr:hypothetical protein MKX08_005469 [Trichoderma sp. CBMAI-0020]
MATVREVSRNTFGNNARLLLGNITNNISKANAGRATISYLAIVHLLRTRPFFKESAKQAPWTIKKRILESKGPLIYDSYRWILDHHAFERWRDKQNNGGFWIKGDHGKGKTMLLCGIIENFENDCKLREKFVYFFCQGTDTRLNTATAIIKGLIYSVLRQNQDLLSSILKQIEKEPKGYLEGINAWDALSRIFINIVQDPCMANFTFIIDALDECQHQESRKSLLNLIMDTGNHVKRLISSRNEKEIKRGLKSIDNRLILELKSNAAHISRAVDTYIDHCARDIEALESGDDLRDTTTKLLKIKANGTFLWVTLVVQQLRDAGHEIPENLESLYDEIMERSKRGWEDDEEACLVFLATVTAAERPLHTDELYLFINSQLVGTKVRYLPNDIQYLAKACGSLITITDHTIYLIHQSLKDYLVQQGAISVFPRGIAYQHLKMFEISLNLMNKALRHNIYNIRSPGEHVDNITPPNPNPLASKAYCCAYWIEHLGHCRQPQLFQDGEILHSFLKEKYLNWIEAMVLLKVFSQAVTAIQKLRDLITNHYTIHGNSNRTHETLDARNLTRIGHGQWLTNTVMSEEKPELLVNSERNETLEMTRDVYRLVFSHRAIIEAYPLQMYASALIFSPSDCISRKLFEVTQCPKWIVAKPLTRPSWNPCVQTIEDNKSFIYSVAISPDNTKLAASFDEMTKIWDLISGACIRTIETENISRVFFSANSVQLALIICKHRCTSGKVEIWDLIAGSHLRIMDGCFESVSFSADGTRLALVNENMVKIHDLTTGVNLYTRTGHADEVFRAVVFSPHHAQLKPESGDGVVGHRATETTNIGATVLTDGTFHATLVILVRKTSIIKILDLATGKCTQTIAMDMDMHDKRWMEVALSSNGTRLALS